MSKRFAIASLGLFLFLPSAFAKIKDVKIYLSKIFNKTQHPDQANKICLGILNFSKKVGNERLTKACQRALDYGI